MFSIILILFVNIPPLRIIHHITLPDLTRRKKANVLIFVQVLQLGWAVPPATPPPAVTSQSTFAQAFVMMFPL